MRTESVAVRLCHFSCKKNKKDIISFGLIKTKKKEKYMDMINSEEIFIESGRLIFETIKYSFCEVK